MEDTLNKTPKYWMSLEQWRQDPEFAKLAENEFLSSPLKSSDGEAEGGWARREFLKLMGASLAMSSFGCIRRPAQRIIPYVNKPVEITHGIPNYYASSFADGYEGLGIVVTTRDGRPIKIEGNPEHAANKGGMSSRAHADILRLYDPDRLAGPAHNLQNDKRTNHESIGTSWEDLDKEVLTQLAKGKVAYLSGACLSPTTQILLDEFSAAFNVKQYRYDDISYDALSEGQRRSFGQAGLPSYELEKAKLIVAVNNDFIGTWLTPTRWQMQFAKGRKADSGMNKLVVFESLHSLTGGNADERYRIRPSQSLEIVMGLLHELLVVKKLSRFAGDTAITGILAGYVRAGDQPGLKATAEALWEHRGKSAVLSGGLTAGTYNAVDLQVATNFLNYVLENDGQTVFPNGATVVAPKVAAQTIGDLITALKAKQISTVIIHNCNPFYSLPESAGFKQAMGFADTVLYTGDRHDETGRNADYVLVDHHALENWGDMLSLDGVRSIQQPTIEPLYQTRAFQDSLMTWIKGANKASAKVKASETWYDYLRSAWNDLGVKGEDAWTKVLQTGVAEAAVKPGATKPFLTAAFTSIKPHAATGKFELALYEKCAIGAGSFANVPWLQELPDPVTKIVWDNYASLSPHDAADLKIKQGMNVTLTVGEQKLTLPAHIQAGQADGVVGVAVGYGRLGAGQVADNVGVNAFKLGAWMNGHRVTAGLDTKIELASGRAELACTMGHHSMEGRQIVVEETLKDHIKDPGGAVHRTKLTTMWSGHKYPGHKWGMTIDLNTCTGCSACVIACQSENNIPTVGKRYVLQGREMHWLRIDRYFVGTPENPATVFQPLPCMHCDNAPCETVCPVIATVHGEEGTNDMIYNRCVGTRYCSNNCPYKVRRFNWFNYQNDIPGPHKMALNPEVTVRFRGVMEKCTFCHHRIQYSKSQAAIHDRKLGSNEIKTACQQSCPTGAIVFGDLNDAQSDVAKQFMAPKSYALLEELNTRPAVRYHVKVRNVDELIAEPPPHGNPLGKEHHV